jgi:mRNA-degrading endonuclease RelE of RelBE toxin-antitoxin system
MGVYSYHLKYSGVDYRIAYTINDNELIVYFISAGTRENFYKTIKRRLA